MKSSRQSAPQVRQTNPLSSSWVLKPVAALVLTAFAVSASLGGASAQASEAQASTEFDTVFLSVSAQDRSGLARFSRSDAVSPGVYSVDIWVNDSHVSHGSVKFVATDTDGNAHACLSRSVLDSYGIDFAKAAADRRQDAQTPAPAEQDCFDLAAAVPGASVDFDFGEQRLVLSIPQKYLRNNARGYVSPELWDKGVNAGFLSYSANAYQYSSGGSHSMQGFLGVNAGVNLGGWHLRHQSSVTAASGRPTEFDDVATWVQHDVTRLRSQVTIGETQTTGDVFDSVPFRGAQINSDDRMLPDSLRGYAPVVRGTADSNAHVTVRQNGQVLYETNVPPGPFEIRDLYATGYGGALDVTVTEADGRTKRFDVPYASVAQLLRPGTTRFAVTAGQLRNESLQTKPVFAQATVQRGLTNLVTLYGGGLAAQGYVATNAGAALNTKYGAFAGDLTAARTQIPGQGTRQGASLHIGYSQLVQSTDTNIAVGAYRYSDAGYLSFADAAQVRDQALHSGDADSVYRQRGRLQLTVNQNLKEHGSVFASISSQQYWNRSGRDVFYQAGYSNSFKYGTYSVTAGRSRSTDGTLSNEVMLSTSIPLGHSPRAPIATTNVSLGKGASSAQTAVAGTLGESNQYSYNAFGAAGWGSDSNGTASGGASGTWRGASMSAMASASGGTSGSQMSAGVSGSVVAHPGGVTFSQTVGDTFGIVEAKGAEGASVSSATGVKVDRHGYAVVPYLTPYSMNAVDIDPKGTSPDVEFDSTSERTAPHSGAIVMLRYKTLTGRAALIRAPLPGGEALPFGSEVTDQAGHPVGVVAQDSRIFARGLESKGALFVKLPEAKSGQCRVDYVLPEHGEGATQASVYPSVEAHCVIAKSVITASQPAEAQTE